MSVRTTGWCLAAIAAMSLSASAQSDKKTEPHWIWLTKTDADETVYLRKEFELTGKCKSAQVGRHLRQRGPIVRQRRKSRRP